MDSFVKASKITSRFVFEENLAATHNSGFDNMVRSFPIFFLHKVKESLLNYVNYIYKTNEYISRKDAKEQRRKEYK